MDAQQAFGELRSLLGREPSRRLWWTILELVEQTWREHPAAVTHDWIPYLQGHLQSWPASSRPYLRRWLTTYHGADPLPPFLQLATCLELELLRARHGVGLQPFDRTSFFASRAIEGLRELRLDHSPPSAGLRSDDLRALLQNPHIRQLEHLDLRSTDLEEDDLHALCAAKTLPHLRALLLSRLSDHSINVLLKATILDQLETLAIEQSALHLEHLLGLGARDLPALRNLSLRSTEFAEPGCHHVFRAEHLPWLHQLQSLDLSDCHIEPEWLYLIADQDCFAGLRTLRWFDRSLNPFALEKLLRTPMFAGLHELGFFSRTPPDQEDEDHQNTQKWAALITEAAALRELRTLQLHRRTDLLERDPLTPAFLHALPRAVYLDSLEHLEIQHGPLEPAQLKLLFDAPLLRKLRHLELISAQGVGFDDRGLARLLDVAEPYHQLEVLILRGQGSFRDTPAEIFERPELFPRLRHLELHDRTGLGDDFARHVADSQLTQQLEHLSFREETFSFTEHGVRALLDSHRLADALKQRWRHWAPPREQYY